MKKYILKDGKEVTFGDIIEAKGKGENYSSYVKVTFCKETLEMLKNFGIVKEIEVDENKVNPDEEVQKFKEGHVDRAYKSIARKLGVTKESAVMFIHDLANLSTQAAFSVMSKRIALQLEKYYNNPMKDLKRGFYISSIDGNIYPINLCNANKLNFALFRTYVDAQFAIDCLGWLYKKMFDDSKQESN